MHHGPIIIVGMHRSGTSCLTGCLEESGLELGDVIESAPHNKKGNRESQAIMNLHEQILADNGGSWDDPPQRVTWTEQHKREQAEIIASYPEDAQWGFKDPRTLVLIDQWLELFPQAQLVGTFRHPVPVALSLAKRSNFGLDSGLALWLDYNLRLLKLWKQYQFPIVNFDLPKSDYANCVAQVALELGLCAPATGFRFLDAALRHNNIPELLSVQAEFESIYSSLKQTAFLRHTALK